MDYAEWAPYYGRIQREFGFSMARERAAADRLRSLLPSEAREAPLERLAPRLRGRDAVIVGLAPRAGAPPLWRGTTGTDPPAIVAADGAARRCLEAGLVPDLVVTDLDGPVASEVTAASRGAAIVVHAHGDNVAALDRWVPEFSGELAGSWAGPPEGGLIDVGGFTDGDRAAFLAQHLGARRVLLWGFEFDRTDEPEGPEQTRKLAKLAWAQRLLALLAAGPTPVLWWKKDGSLQPYPPAPSTQ